VKKYLFVCGAPRSGTTAMWKLLTADDRIVLGVERYGNLFFKHALTTELFELDRFMKLEAGDTFYADLCQFNDYYSTIPKRYESAIYVGDKIPLLYRYLKPLLKEIPEAKIVFMLRNIFDVAASYEARANDLADSSWARDKRTASAVRDWHNSLVALKELQTDNRVYPVIFEDFFFSDASLDNLYAFLSLDVTEENRTRHNHLLARSRQLEATRKRNLSAQDVVHICTTAPFGLYRELLSKIRSSSARNSTPTS
jgi:hypothetical protein